jgi:hypothetical protein
MPFDSRKEDRKHGLSYYIAVNNYMALNICQALPPVPFSGGASDSFNAGSGPFDAPPSCFLFALTGLSARSAANPSADT